MLSKKGARRERKDAKDALDPGDWESRRQSSYTVFTVTFCQEVRKNGRQEQIVEFDFEADFLDWVNTQTPNATVRNDGVTESFMGTFFKDLSNSQGIFTSALEQVLLSCFLSKWRTEKELECRSIVQSDSKDTQCCLQREKTGRPKRQQQDMF